MGNFPIAHEQMLDTLEQDGLIVRDGESSTMIDKGRDYVRAPHRVVS